MIKDRKEMINKPMEIDLTGPEGNAFCLLGYARNFCRQMELDWEKVEKEMTADDYDHLVDVFDSYFGEYVTLYR